MRLTEEKEMTHLIHNLHAVRRISCTMRRKTNISIFFKVKNLLLNTISGSKLMACF